MQPQLTIGQCATLACLLEATAPKVGNVHRGADFDDVTFTDFAVSAVAIGPAMECAVDAGVGRSVLQAILATRQLVATNTNLGMVLLIAPLAAVRRDESLAEGVARVLRSLTAEDSWLVYEAIRLASPGGLGRVEEMDIAAQAPRDLLAAMRAAADRDLIAAQYIADFSLVLGDLCNWLLDDTQKGWSLTDSIIHTHLRLLAKHPDSLIARKCGLELARQISARAAAALNAGQPGDDPYHEAVCDLDFYLRSDGNWRNPGTSADLIAGALFALLRDGRLLPPLN